MANLDLLALDLEGAGLGAVRAVDGARQLASAGAQKAGQADDLAAAELEVKGLDLAGVAEALGVDELLAGGGQAALGLDGGQVVEVLAHHGGDELDAGEVCDGIFAHQRAVAKHGDAVAHGVDLLQEVRDEHDAHALVAQAAHQGEELFHLHIVQGGGRLVEDEHLAVHVHRAGDGDHLLHGQGVFLQIARHVHGQVELLHQLPRAGDHGLAVDGVHFRHRFAADEEVLRHREVRAEVDLLIHGGNAALLGLQRGVVAHGPFNALHADLARLKIVHAGQTLDQRGLASAVFAHQRMDLALAKGEIHMVQRLDPREGHGDAAHGQDDVVFHRAPRPFFLIMELKRFIQIVFMPSCRPENGERGRGHAAAPRMSKKLAFGDLFRQMLKKCLRPGAQTPRPPGTGGKRQPCGLLREAQSDPKVGSETSGGRDQRPPRRLSDRGKPGDTN